MARELRQAFVEVKHCEGSSYGYALPLYIPGCSSVVVAVIVHSLCVQS